MTPDELDAKVSDLVQAARDDYLSDEEIIDVLLENAKAVQEGLS